MTLTLRNTLDLVLTDGGDENGLYCEKVSQISGISVRTLHFYDEIEVLKPAYYAENGYRYYEEEQLLLLKQILFFRELGIELKKLQSILNRSDFDKAAALHSHKQILLKEIDRKQELIQTIDRTMGRLKGKTKMKDQELYLGFSPETQEEYEKFLQDKLGDHPSFNESKRNVKNWTKAEWNKSSQEWNSICADLGKLLKKQMSVDSKEVQGVIRRHYEWLKQFWTPNRESYTGMGMGYTGFEWKKAFEVYDSHHPKLAEFLATAMKAFADRELT